jgi:hypothetical protein
MAKIGAPPGVRKFLGYHVDREDNTMATYSRDLASEPLRQLEKMITAVRIGCFMPDQTRSGTMKGKLAQVGFMAWNPGMEEGEVFGESGGDVVADDEFDDAVREEFGSDVGFGDVETSNTAAEVVPEPEKQASSIPPVIDPESDSDPSSSSAESSAADVAVAREAKEVEFCSAEDKLDIEDGRLFFHNVFTTVHKLADNQVAKFKCGRAIRLGYAKLDRLTGVWPKCRVCFP